MARPLRIEYEGAIHHVTARGNGGMRIFLDERDYESFLLRVGAQIERYAVRLYLYCLMPNHVHMVVETPRANLGQFMQALQTSYALYFNHRHKRVGHLLGGRFGSQLVEEDTYLLRLSQYVHLNPVRVRAIRGLPLAERRKRLRSFAWSSYRGYAGLMPRAPFVTYGPVLAHVAAGGASPEREYRRFVELGMTETDAEFEQMMQQSRRGLGDDEFLQRVEALRQDAADARCQEDVAFRRTLGSASPERVIEAVAAAFNTTADAIRQRSRGSAARLAAAWLLCRCGGLTQREVATWLNVGTGAAVCVQIKRCEQQLQTDARLRHILTHLQGELELTGS